MANADASCAFLAENLERFSSIRREFHMRPELAYEETETSTRIADFLTDIGWTVSRGIGGTGVVATLAGGAGPTIGAAFRHGRSPNSRKEQCRALKSLRGENARLPAMTDI